jgi:hypothetical protein
MRSPYRTDAREETTDAPGRQQRNKEPRTKGAAASEEGEDNRQRHQRMSQKTKAKSGKLEGIMRSATNSRVGGREASSRDLLKTAENECQDTVEGSAPSETKKETINNSLRALNIGAVTTLGTFGRTNRKIMATNLD